MKKILSILTACIFVFALTMSFSSCGDDASGSGSGSGSAVESSGSASGSAVECSADCAKACCLGCKATEGDKKCIKLEDGTMPCCVVSSDDEGGDCAADCAKACCAKKECADDCDKECCDAAACCCGDATCDGSCHDEEEGGDWEPPGGNMERYMDLIEEGKSHEEAVEIMENEY